MVQFGVCRAQIVARLDRCKLGIRQLHLYQTEIQLGFDFISIQRVDLLLDRFTLTHSLVRDLNQPLAFQDREIASLNSEDHIGAASYGFLFYPCPIGSLRFDPILRLPEVIQQLTRGHAYRHIALIRLDE
jgi:hypothetical protein